MFALTTRLLLSTQGGRWKAMRVIPKAVISRHWPTAARKDEKQTLILICATAALDPSPTPHRQLEKPEADICGTLIALAQPAALTGNGGKFHLQTAPEKT
jgi:hypothetical protein